MRIFSQNSPKVRAFCGVVGGLLLVFNAIVGYATMHFAFFGAPHLTLSTPMGRSEIMYTLSTLMVAGWGVVFFYIGLRARRELR
jgi:hypothetical protein